MMRKINHDFHAGIINIVTNKILHVSGFIQYFANGIQTGSTSFATFRKNNDVLILYRCRVSPLEYRIAVRSLFLKKRKNFYIDIGVKEKSVSFKGSADRIFVKEKENIIIFGIRERTIKLDYFLERETIIEFKENISWIRFSQDKYYFFGNSDAALYIYEPKEKKLQVKNLVVKKLANKILKVHYFEVKKNRVRAILELRIIISRGFFDYSSYIELRAFNCNLE